MNLRNFLFFLLIILVLGVVLTACGGKGELDCELDSDCKKTYFEGLCTDGACDYEPIAGECGNKLCEEDAGENSCTCEKDCRACSGTVDGAKYLLGLPVVVPNS